MLFLEQSTGLGAYFKDPSVFNVVILFCFLKPALSFHGSNFEKGAAPTANAILTVN